MDLFLGSFSDKEDEGERLGLRDWLERVVGMTCSSQWMERGRACIGSGEG